MIKNESLIRSLIFNTSTNCLCNIFSNIFFSLVAATGVTESST